MSSDTVNHELINDFSVQSYDKHGEVDIYKFTQLVVQHAVGITRMSQYRNGHDSAENRAIRKIREDILAYFGVEEKDINEIMAESELFREYFKLPRKGD